MSRNIHRREFMKTSAAAGAAALVPGALPRRDGGTAAAGQAPTVLVRKTVEPVVVSDLSGIQFKNGGPESAVEVAYRMITAGEDVLESVVSGVNVTELDPTESGVGYGGLPNAEGTVQLDACCMHGPRKWAGGVAALEGVRTPSRVAKAVAELTDHHLLVGKGAQDFARSLGFTIEDDLNTKESRERWLEWKRRVDPDHYLDPLERTRRGYEVGLEMVREGLIDRESFWGTVHCSGINPAGEICAVTTTSGLAWKIPGRVGDSPILGAGLYVDGDVGSAGSTGRGEANLFNLSCFLIVEQLRQGMHPKDAGMAALRRIRENTIEDRLLNDRGEPAFDVRFFVLDKSGRYAGVAMYGSGEREYGVCTAQGPQRQALEGLLEGSPTE